MIFRKGVGMASCECKFCLHITVADEISQHVEHVAVFPPNGQCVHDFRCITDTCEVISADHSKSLTNKCT